MNQKKQFKPQNLRSLLSILLVLVFGGGAALFYLGNTMVGEYAVEVNHRLADADASGKQIDELRTLKNELSKSDSLVSKANKIFATPSKYQSDVLNDLNRYAGRANLSIAKYTFDNPSATGNYAVTIRLQQPVNYNRFIAFLNNVEGNIPKLQVTSIELGPGSSANTVSTGDIKINISVR